MNNKTAIKVILCEMVVKSESTKTQDDIDVLTSNIADRIERLFVSNSVCYHGGFKNATRNHDCENEDCLTCECNQNKK